MMKHGSQRVSMVAKACLVLSCAGAIACDVEDMDLDDADLDEEVFLREQGDNGVALNSAQFNGWQLNGWQLNGWQLNGWQLNGWQLNGWQLNGVSLNGSMFTGNKVVNGQTVVVQGVGLIGAEIALSGPNGPATLRIDDIYKDPAKPAGDVYFHRFSVLDAASGTWSSLCTDGAGQPAAAIVLANAWNMTTGARVDSADAVTIACRGAALAKCVEFGYRPWATATSCTGPNCTQISLKEHHQACTRMVRADYCGDGTPHTFEGTPIDIFDKLSPVIQAEGTKGLKNWKVEAEWGPGGALCAGKELRLKMFDDRGIPYTTPTCLASLQAIAHCGDFAPSRAAKLVNKYCQKWTDSSTACSAL